MSDVWLTKLGQLRDSFILKWGRKQLEDDYQMAVSRALPPRREHDVVETVV